MKKMKRTLNSIHVTDEYEKTLQFEIIMANGSQFVVPQSTYLSKVINAK